MSRPPVPKHAKEALAAIKAEGLIVDEWDGGGNTHYKFYVTTPEGRKAVITISASPKNKTQNTTYVRKNARAILKGTA